MKIALVTDAWLPQVNGVVTTLLELVRDLESRRHEVLVIHPGQFKTKPCPGYSGIDLAQRPRAQLSRQLDGFAEVDLVDCASEIGSGALPDHNLPSLGIALRPRPSPRSHDESLERLARAFRELPVPVIRE